jgi:hypothetical protein
VGIAPGIGRGGSRHGEPLASERAVPRGSKLFG